MKLTTRQRRNVHVASEAAAIALLVPVMWYARKEVKSPALRAGLAAGIVGTILIDGLLLYNYLGRR